MRRVKRQAKKDGVTIRNLKSVIIKEELNGSGDGPRTWKKETFIDGFAIFDQENGEYIDISPEDLDVTEEEYQQLSLDKAVDRWLTKRAIYGVKQ